MFIKEGLSNADINEIKKYLRDLKKLAKTTQEIFW
jgi:hypothetical protein